jgi:hypothetical protein
LTILWLGARKKWVWGYQLEAKDSQLKDEQVQHMGEVGELRARHLSEINAIREERDQWRRMSLMQQGQRGPTTPPPGPMEGDD